MSLSYVSVRIVCSGHPKEGTLLCTFNFNVAFVIGELGWFSVSLCAGSTRIRIECKVCSPH